MKKTIIFLCVSLWVFSCNTNSKGLVEKSKKEITATEREFAAFCKQNGMEAAFVKYADDSAVIHRNDKIIRGKDSIGAFYKSRPLKNTTLDWWPDYVNVSSSADLGYTYGHFVYTSKDSTGKATEYKGIFHTVWKKQKDGTWRYLWD